MDSHDNPATHWYVSLGSKEFIVTGYLDEIVFRFPFSRVRPAKQEDVDRIEKKAKEAEKLKEKLKAARR